MSAWCIQPIVEKLKLELFAECVSAEGEAPQCTAPAAAPPTKSTESALPPALVYAMCICSGAIGARKAAAAEAASAAAAVALGRNEGGGRRLEVRASLNGK
jgi:hypothetical protein